MELRRVAARRSEGYGSIGMTPIWVPLAVGGVAAVLGLVGVILTQRAADHRASADRLDAKQRDESRIATEVEQRRIDWQRANMLDAHANFLAEQWKAEHHMTMYNQVGNVAEPTPDWTEPMARQLNVVRIFSTAETYARAMALFKVTGEMATPAWGVGRYLVLDDAKDLYISAVQRELGIAETTPVSFYDEASAHTEGLSS